MSCDILVIGAGVVGSGLAMHLAKFGASDTWIIDFDLEGSLSSSELNAGGVRATWGQPLNVELSKRTIEYLASVADEVGYRACGYLWLYGADRLPYALQARERQVAGGWPVEALDLAELRRRVPFIDKTDDLAGAVFAPRDGLVNPNLLKNHYRAAARAGGARFDDRVWVVGAEFEASSSRPWRVRGERFARSLTIEEKTEFLSGRAIDVPREAVEYRAARVVNAAGAWASSLARILGYASPSFAVRRQVSIFDCRDVDLSAYGMIVDSSGVYFHPEATNGLAGFANHQEPRGINYAYDGESFFTEVIWPALYERSSAFERLRHLTGWAGLYEVSPDESAIIGPVSAQVKAGEAGRERLFETHSYSGHGVMQSYSAGQVLAERIVTGRYQTVDAEPLQAARFETGRLLAERLVI